MRRYTYSKQNSPRKRFSSGTVNRVNRFARLPSSIILWYFTIIYRYIRYTLDLDWREIDRRTDGKTENDRHLPIGTMSARRRDHQISGLCKMLRYFPSQHHHSSSSSSLITCYVTSRIFLCRYSDKLSRRYFMIY